MALAPRPLSPVEISLPKVFTSPSAANSKPSRACLATVGIPAHAVSTMEFRVSQGIYEDFCTTHRDSCPQIVPRLVPINWFAATTSEKVASVHLHCSVLHVLKLAHSSSLSCCLLSSALYHCISTTNRQFLVSGRDTIFPPPYSLLHRALPSTSPATTSRRRLNPLINT